MYPNEYKARPYVKVVKKNETIIHSTPVLWHEFLTGYFYSLIFQSYASLNLIKYMKVIGLKLKVEKNSTQEK